LLQYIEPISQPVDVTGCQIRVDSGVVPGGSISSFYDPMIAKLVAFSPNNRNEAIIALSDALDRYVIRGVKHNGSFTADLLRHPDFRAGRTSTDFIATHYPNGFVGVELSALELHELCAIAATISSLQTSLLERPALPLSSGDMLGRSEEIIVCLGGMFGDAYSVQAVAGKTGHLSVRKISHQESEVEEHHHIIMQSVLYDPLHPVVEVEVNGSKRSIQVIIYLTVSVCDR